MNQELKVLGLLLMWLFGMCTGYVTAYSVMRTREAATHRQTPLGNR